MPHTTKTQSTLPFDRIATTVAALVIVGLAVFLLIRNQPIADPRLFFVNASPGQAVYEPFSGSGTTIIAAEMTGRVCHAIEIAPAYIDVAVKRWQEFTGQQAVLDGDGRSFDNVAAQRAR